ncbi:hypothetical protein IEQ34_024182 [Dendrobium chrysotoxum]|uniref:Uncharacterized protein n=1 Tax=Dendrobium chrysotoxum TaxID=161865 RepID=A0AAV7FUH5_DENCH|nr:hypothetical protein IEQ34_024182 [Dendrobium chrysotoxum]
MKGISCRGNHICFGRYALQALEPAWITARQIFLSTVKERRGAAREVVREEPLGHSSKARGELLGHTSHQEKRKTRLVSRQKRFDRDRTNFLSRNQPGYSISEIESSEAWNEPHWEDEREALWQAFKGKEHIK